MLGGLFSLYCSHVAGVAHTKQGALKSRGIDKLLEEAKEDNKENDDTYMGRKCKLHRDF